MKKVIITEEQLNKVLNLKEEFGPIEPKRGPIKLSNCPTNRDDEELTEGVTYLSKEQTNLSVDIIVDCGETYKWYRHPLCLFIVNGDSVIPVTISQVPKGPNGVIIPPDVISFIKHNIKLLTDFANMVIDGPDFYDALSHRLNENETVNEMSNFGPDKTGLPI